MGLRSHQRPFYNTDFILWKRLCAIDVHKTPSSADTILSLCRFADFVKLNPEVFLWTAQYRERSIRQMAIRKYNLHHTELW